MSTRDFRFGITLDATLPRTEWQHAARRAEEAGFDTILVADHLDMGAPLPALLAAAAVTSRIRLGTLVLNSGFYRPALLARDAAALHRFTDGRFELGLGAGAGFAAHEFAEAELPFPSARERVDHLGHTVEQVRRMLSSDGHDIPIMVAGRGDRVLGTAARQADIVNITGVEGTSRAGRFDALAQRVETIRAAAGDRFDRMELSLPVALVHLTGSGAPDLTVLRRFYPNLPDDDLLELPGVLHGSPGQIADQLHQYREDYGITYFTIGDQGQNQEATAAVIQHVR